MNSFLTTLVTLSLTFQQFIVQTSRVHKKKQKIDTRHGLYFEKLEDKKIVLSYNNTLLKCRSCFEKSLTIKNQIINQPLFIFVQKNSGKTCVDKLPNDF